jgi:hypothetical protein
METRVIANITGTTCRCLARDEMNMRAATGVRAGEHQQPATSERAKHA